MQRTEAAPLSHTFFAGGRTSRLAYDLVKDAVTDNVDIAEERWTSAMIHCQVARGLMEEAQHDVLAGQKPRFRYLRAPTHRAFLSGMSLFKTLTLHLCEYLATQRANAARSSGSILLHGVMIEGSDLTSTSFTHLY